MQRLLFPVICCGRESRRRGRSRNVFVRLTGFRSIIIIGEFILEVDGFNSAGGLWSGVVALGFLVLQLSTLFLN